MFTGLVESIGLIAQIVRNPEDLSLTIQVEPAFLKEVKLGASISVNGVCLTAVNLTDNTFEVDVSNETLRCTTLGDAVEGDHVNLEHCLTLSKPLGGHLLTGHVHGVGVVRSVVQQGRSIVYEIEIARDLMKYMAPKGCVGVEGVSLTVNDVTQSTFFLTLIPHTLSHTNLQFKVKGDRVNIEIDLMCLYLERLVSYDAVEEVRLYDPDLMERLGFSRTEH